MFLPLTSTWKMVKDSTNHVMMNMIGLAHTSREILEDGDVPIFPVVLSNPYSLQFNFDCTGILLSTFCVEVNTICIWPYIQCKHATHLRAGNLLYNHKWLDTLFHNLITNALPYYPINISISFLWSYKYCDFYSV